MFIQPALHRTVAEFPQSESPKISGEIKMAIFATGVNKANLESTVKQICTKLHTAFSDARSIQRVLSEWADPDLMAALNTSDPSEVASLRELIQHIVELEENYRGQGTLNNRAFHIAKRVDIISR